MLVKELIEKLQQLDPELAVFVSEDTCGCSGGFSEALFVEMLDLDTGEPSERGSPVIMTWKV